MKVSSFQFAMFKSGMLYGNFGMQVNFAEEGANGPSDLPDVGAPYITNQIREMVGTPRFIVFSNTPVVRSKQHVFNLLMAFSSSFGRGLREVVVQYAGMRDASWMNGQPFMTFVRRNPTFTAAEFTPAAAPFLQHLLPQDVISVEFDTPTAVISVHNQQMEMITLFLEMVSRLAATPCQGHFLLRCSKPFADTIDEQLSSLPGVLNRFVIRVQTH